VPGERVSIIVVTFNNLVFNRLCLESVLANSEGYDYEIIVVDNASDDGTVEYLRELTQSYPRLRTFFNRRNLGFAAATNQGLERATGTIFILLNNDTLVPGGWLARLVKHLKDPAIGLVGPVTNRAGNEAEIETSYRTWREFIRFADDYMGGHDAARFDIRTATMFCTALRRDVYERVGPLDESFEVGLFEDDDYAMRVRDAGYRVACAEDVFVHHFGQASLGKLAATGEYGKRFHANRRRWEQKWGATWQPYQRRPRAGYREMTVQIREFVDRALPLDAAVLVISRGDEQLLDLKGRQARHFPQDENGTYAGHHPADSTAAIAELESLRVAGRGKYLLIPATEFWWLEHYCQFGDHLRDNYSIVLEEKDACIIFALSKVGA
jgi:GT2 family glycosyltransferase